MRKAVTGSVTYSTMGQSNPSPLTERSGYQYRGRDGWPFDPETRDDKGETRKPQGGAEARKAQRARNLAEFTAARAEGLDIEAAGERVGVVRETAYRYEKARKARKAALEQQDTP